MVLLLRTKDCNPKALDRKPQALMPIDPKPQGLGFRVAYARHFLTEIAAASELQSACRNSMWAVQKTCELRDP